MSKLIGLQGVRGDVEIGPDQIIRTSKSAVRGLTKARARTTAGDLGAITIWRDEENRCWRGERHQYRCTESKCMVLRLAQLKEWLDTELPKIGDRVALAAKEG